MGGRRPRRLRRAADVVAMARSPQATGAIGLLVGLAVPPVGIAATIGVVLYVLGALATVVRAGAYGHIPFPLRYLVPVVVAAALGGSG